MTNERIYTRIKQAVEEQRRKTVQGETRMQSLNEEKERIFESISNEIGQKITSVDEVESYLELKKKEIEDDIKAVAQTLDEEGIDY